MPICSHLFLLAGLSKRSDLGMKMRLLAQRGDIILIRLLPTSAIVIDAFLSGWKLTSPTVVNLSCRKQRGSKLSYFDFRYLKLTHPISSPSSSRNTRYSFTLSSRGSCSLSPPGRLNCVLPFPSICILLRWASNENAERVSLPAEGVQCFNCKTQCERYSF